MQVALRSVRPMPTSTRSPIHRLRLAAGLSVGALARRAGLPEATVAALDQGRHSPTARTARALIAALGCTLDELLGMDSEGPQQAG